MWEIDCKKLYKIHIYAFTVWTNLLTDHVKAQRKSQTKNKNTNMNRTDLEKKSNGNV